MHDKDRQSRSNIGVLDRYYRMQSHSSPPQVVEEAEVEEVVEEAEVVVEAEEYHLGRTDRKQLSIHTQGNNSIAMAEVEVVEVDIQYNLEQ
jgi:hypothetical protein